MHKSFCLMFMCGFALTLLGCSNGDVKTLASTATQNPAPIDNVFNMDQHLFAATFNTTAKAFKQTFRIEQIDIKIGVIDDYFQQQLAEDTTLIVAFSKGSGRISSITGLVVQKNGYVDTHALKAIAKVVIGAASPGLAHEKIVRIVNDMVYEIGEQNNVAMPPRYFDEARYVLRNNDRGFWVIANPA